jgi:16S rRNA C967 or C1407 C5-methylase (RsmB/RsmF family)/NOL1/NOP2/fmu family ribosome biogenesis protein
MKHAIPPAFEEQMKVVLPHEWPLLKETLATPSPVSIRVNEKKYQYTSEHAVPWTTTGFYLAERPVFTLDPVFHAGAYYVQEASSMFLEQALRQTVDLQQPLRVLDLCAAPGGKSTHAVSLLHPDSLLVSNEVIRSRAAILSENMQKWGTPNVVVTNNDPEDFTKLPGFFDVIIADAPCSGEGLFRKDPDAMAEWSENNVQLCSKRQRRIISDIWPCLRENGILIYSTCTYNTLENEENLHWLKQHHDAEFLSLETSPDWGVETIGDHGIRGYRFYPHRVKGEGFFLSVIRKKEAQQEYQFKKTKFVINNSFQAPSKKIQEQLKEWVKEPETKAFIQRDQVVQFFPAAQAETIQILAHNLHLVSAGTFMATLKHDKLIPEHAFALSTALNDIFPSLELTEEQALQYLRKETLSLETHHTGFSLMKYRGIPLGWGNVLPNRINNLYPAEWRIRMSK